MAMVEPARPAYLPRQALSKKLAHLTAGRQPGIEYRSPAVKFFAAKSRIACFHHDAGMVGGCELNSSMYFESLKVKSGS
jgi:hypothetical protein